MENIKQHEIQDCKDFLLDILPKAGQILRQYFHAEELPSKKKGVHDIVTAGDLAVDAFLREKLTKAYPTIPLLTEETAKGDINTYAKEPRLWIIDPLDGTANFARSDANFSISVALVQQSVPILGVIFAPISSRLFWATSYEKHAYWNGRRIHVSSIDELGKASVCTDWSHILETRDQTTAFLKKVYGHVRQIKILGSAATDLTLLARGGIDIYHHVHLYPWDVAAAAFIAHKAGAKVTQTDGKPWNAFSPSILAANPTLHKAISNLQVK